MPTKHKVVTRKYNGDDQYSYAVFVDGKVVPELTGLNRPQATYYRNQVVDRLAAANGGGTVKEKPIGEKKPTRKRRAKGEAPPRQARLEPGDELLAVGGYSSTEFIHGWPEQQLEAFLDAAGIAHELLGAGTSLGTGERDVEMAITATPAQRKLVELYIEHTGMDDVWELMDRGDDD